MYYTLVNYFDVWGNEKEGWEVNNQCIEFDDLYLDAGITDKEICEYLKNIDMLNTSDMRRVTVIDDGFVIEIYEKRGMKPLLCLMPNTL